MPVHQSQTQYKKFELSHSFIRDYIGRQPKWGPIGYLVYKRTYARPKPDGTTEEWWETCKRVVEGCYQTQYDHCKYLNIPWDSYKAQKSAQKMFQLMWDFKFLPPGRGLWMMGTDYIRERGGAALNNCAFISTEHINEDFSYPFRFLMDMSMLGVGVGLDVRGAGKVKLSVPRVSSGETYVVADSREGWCDLIARILDSYVSKSTYPGKIDYSNIRPAGVPIRSFGGVSGGPAILEELVDNINSILMPLAKEGAFITSEAIVDIANYIGKAVISGNVRRSAEIILGFPDDNDFLNLKQDPKALLSHRWASNNSVIAHIGMDYKKIAEKISVNGEPGIFWLENARAYSRMSDPPDYKDIDAVGVNPCSEQTLCDAELCCLVETFPSLHESLQEFLITLKYAYLYAKTVTLIPTHNPKTNAVVMRNRRIGTSMSGIAQAIEKFGYREFMKWCDHGYKKLRELDNQYSDWLCVPRSRKITSVKPSGTVSLLPGVTPGVHFPYGKYYIRRIRMSGNSRLAELCKKHGYYVEQDVTDKHACVLSVPIKEEYFSKARRDVSMWEQIELVAQIQANWSDNQVSATITFNESEKRDIATALSMYETRLKSISFLPLDVKSYAQTPYQEITESEYNNLVSQIKRNLVEVVQEAYACSQTENDHVEDKMCDSEVCSI